MYRALLICALFGAVRGAEFVADTNWSATPIPLFLNSSSTTFELQSEGVEFLRRLGNTPVSLVSVGGQARAGKSFLLNNLMDAEHCTAPPCAGGGFAVGSTFESCTRGVWLWGRPVFKRDPGTGERFAVVYMDTEGLGAIGNVRDNQDPKLALFASLFSSSFYYVVHRVISQEAVDFLHSVAVFSNKVQRDIAGGHGALAASATATEGDFAFGSLFWVVQSAELCDSAAAGDTGGVVAGRARCAEQMVARALQPKDAGDAPAEVVQRYNDVVELVTTRFAPITDGGPRAMAMAHPKPFACPDEGLDAVQVTKCRKLRSDELPRVPFESLDADYKAQVLALRDVMQRRASPKRMMGQAGPLTGTSFARLSERVLAYFNTFNGTVDRGILAEFADAAADEAVSVFEATLTGAVEQALVARGAGDPAVLPESITSALEALTARLGRNRAGHGATHDALDTRARSKGALQQTRGATDPGSSIDVEELETACGAAHDMAMQHFDGGGSHDRGHSDENRFRKAARQRLEADIAAATARMAIANRAAAQQFCEHELAHSFVATVGQRAIGVGLGGAASGSSKGVSATAMTAFRSHAEYEAAKGAFKEQWHHQCSLPTEEKSAMWARFAGTQLALHDTIAAREAGRQALRGLRSTVLRAAVATVGVSVATAWTPGCPQSLHSTVLFARSILVGAALVVTAVDLQLAPELLDDVALEKFAAWAAPLLGRLEVVIDGIASREASLRNAIVGRMQGLDSGTDQPSGSALQHCIAVLLEAFVVVFLIRRATPTWQQMRARAVARQHERGRCAAVCAARTAATAAEAAANAARKALDAVDALNAASVQGGTEGGSGVEFKSEADRGALSRQSLAFEPSHALVRSPAPQLLSRSKRLPVLEDAATGAVSAYTPAGYAQRRTTAKTSKLRMQLPKRGAQHNSGGQSSSPAPLGDATNSPHVGRDSTSTVSPALRAFRRTTRARAITSAAGRAHYSHNLG